VSTHTIVRAAGGVVLRATSAGPEVLVVHRPRYDDWSLPKGKLGSGERYREGALREVWEETGLRCRPGPQVGSARYRDAKGRDKRVRYWVMRIEDGVAFKPSHEVDEIRWMRLERACSILSYEHDRRVVEAAGALCTPLYLVRHAKAGSRAQWVGDDHDRPLTGKGHRQASGLVATMAGRPVGRIVSSPSLRCVQTVEPLAADRALEIERVSWLGEGTPTRTALARVGAQPGPAVLCSHGDVIPAVVGALLDEGVPSQGPVAWKKGATWVVERPAGFPAAVWYEPPPRDRAIPAQGAAR
jgi:phosphohistidine phosphatase SixA/8-oxo-dGTP pyrophosphatase MutT (NUDIX family)